MWLPRLRYDARPLPSGGDRVVQIVVNTYRWIVRNELVTVGLILVVASGIGGFVSIADEVLDGDSHEIDDRILLSLRAAGDPTDRIGPNWFEEMARTLTGRPVSLRFFRSLDSRSLGRIRLMRQSKLFNSVAYSW